MKSGKGISESSLQSSVLNIPPFGEYTTLWWIYHPKSAAAAKSLQSCLTLWPHRRQPTRLPHPWDSPGKNTEVGCHFLLQCMKVKSESEVTQSPQTWLVSGYDRLLCAAHGEVGKSPTGRVEPQRLTPIHLTFWFRPWLHSIPTELPWMSSQPLLCFSACKMGLRAKPPSSVLVRVK